MALGFRIELEFTEMLVFEERGKPEDTEKNLLEQGENQQQTQPTCDAGSGNRTQATLVGGERYHQWSNSRNHNISLSASSSLSSSSSSAAASVTLQHIITIIIVVSCLEKWSLSFVLQVVAGAAEAISECVVNEEVREMCSLSDPVTYRVVELFLSRSIRAASRWRQPLHHKA